MMPRGEEKVNEWDQEYLGHDTVKHAQRGPCPAGHGTPYQTHANYRQ